MEPRRFGLRPVTPRSSLTPRGGPSTPASGPGGAPRTPRVWRPKGPQESPGNPSRILKKEEKEQLLRKLTPMQYRVTQEKITERPYSNKYYKHWERGVYCCVVCGEELFLSHTKYDSGSGWPAFYDIISKDKVSLKQDLSHVGANLLLLVCNPSLARTEVACATCGAHVGHVFDDGPKPTGQRFCVNSSSLTFKPQGPVDENCVPNLERMHEKIWSASSPRPAEPIVHLASPSNSCALGARMCFRVSNMDACEATTPQS
ncbi:methionine-R-sulfoxide reductase B1-like [Homarus americanus]|nr:methionine-R-sulfoxide reductase B1-like [Homarus americanus]XP_042205834.1 methionine-R-sulfoxide reductase B1-like [Homarus americanus]